MTNSNGDRIDRIEAALERFINETNKRLDSNAKALEAFQNQSRENEQRASSDRSRLYESMSRLATAQADQDMARVCTKRHWIEYQNRARLIARQAFRFYPDQAEALYEKLILTFPHPFIEDYISRARFQT